MKKIVCSLLACSALLLVGCGANSKKTEEFIGDHIIETRNNIYTGKDENIYATFCSGERENPYDLDGKVSEKVPFGIVTVAKFDTEKFLQDEYMFTITINGEAISGSVKKSPYDNSYSADIEKAVDDNAEISIEISLDGTNFNQSLYNESKNFTINQTKAVEIASEELSASLEEMTKDKKSAEAVIKILKDFSGEDNRYFWYVGLVGEEGKTAGVLIDANSGEVVSKKV